MSALPQITVSDPPETPKASGTSLSGWNMLLIAVITALIVFLVGTTLDYFLLADAHDSRTTVIEVSDALGGLVAGAFMFRLLRYERERRERLRQKLAIIADMNHHVRNALQVISFHAYSNTDKQQLEAVRESMERIQWALKEILPKL